MASSHTRNFVRGLAKTSFYKARFFEGVAPQRGIELNLKHLLGRPPVDQAEMSAHISLLASGGHDAVIDFIVDGAEYAEVFGDDVVPYTRSFTSAAGIPNNSFARMATLERGFAISDSAIGSRSQLANGLARNTTAYIQLPSGASFTGRGPAQRTWHHRTVRCQEALQQRWWRFHPDPQRRLRRFRPGTAGAGSVPTLPG